MVTVSSLCKSNIRSVLIIKKADGTVQTDSLSMEHQVPAESYHKRRYER